MTIALALLQRYWLHAVVLGALVWALWGGYGFAYQNGYNAANVRAEQVIAEFAQAEAAAQRKARRTEQANAQAVAKIATDTEATIHEIQTNADRLAADLAAGTERMRDHWQGCIATNRLSGDAAAARLADEAEQLRRAGAVDLVHLADLADARESAWRAYAEAVTK